jgi:hypothetical protein
VLKIIISLLFFLQSISLLANEYPPALTNFLKCLFLDSESGYVFFGSKPVCYYCVGDQNALMLGSSVHEQQATLRNGIHWWEAAHPAQENDKFVLKIRPNREGYEILSLNKKEILRAVEENLVLFQYILGHKITPEYLFTTLATSDESFYTLLNNNNALVGILLGFGTENSILGSRNEDLIELIQASPEIPYASLSHQTFEKALDHFTLSIVHKDNFKRSSDKMRYVSLGFSSVEEEAKHVQRLEEPPSRLLSIYSPRLIFQDFRLQKNSNERRTLHEAEQKAIIDLLHADDFTGQVLKRLSIEFLSPSVTVLTAEPSPMILASELRETLRKRLLDDLEGVCQGIQDANEVKEDRYPQTDLNLFYDLLAFSNIQKGLRLTEQHFTGLRKDSSFNELNELVFVKKLEENLSTSSFHVLQKVNSIATFSYVAYLPLQSNELPIKIGSHSTLNLNEVIPGLAVGVQGMKIGELREVHIHPDASYGFLADPEISGPLKFVIRLEGIDLESHPLNLKPNPLALDLTRIGSQEEINTLHTINKALSYHLGKSFWNFYKTVLSSSSQELIEQLKIVWNNPEQRIADQSLDRATLTVYKKQYQMEKDRMIAVIKSNPSAIQLIENLLYIQLEKKGVGSDSWPKSLSLTYKDMNGNILKQSRFESMAADEMERLCLGLKIGLKKCSAGDKGILSIDPDLTDQGLFRNNLSHRALFVEFEVRDPV